MPPPPGLSPALAARLSAGQSGGTAPSSDLQRVDRGNRGGAYGGGGAALSIMAAGGRGGSDYSKLRGIIRSQKDQIQGLENEVAHFQARLHRIEDGHRLELARLKKEVEYHKRLRQGADQRSFELEDRLSRATQQQQAAARHSSHDEEKDTLIVQSQLLVSKNSELTYKLKTMEAQVTQLEELKAALECELDQAYSERDELAAELEQILSRQHDQLQLAGEEREEDASDALAVGEEGEPAE